MELWYILSQTGDQMNGTAGIASIVATIAVSLYALFDKFLIPIAQKKLLSNGKNGPANPLAGKVDRNERDIRDLSERDRERSRDIQEVKDALPQVRADVEFISRILERIEKKLD